jgi:hypothetical protein
MAVKRIHRKGSKLCKILGGSVWGSKDQQEALRRTGFMLLTQAAIAWGVSPTRGE